MLNVVINNYMCRIGSCSLEKSTICGETSANNIYGLIPWLDFFHMFFFHVFDRLFIRSYHYKMSVKQFMQAL